MKTRGRRREVLLRIEDYCRQTREPKVLRVDVTLVGLAAAVVKQIADLSQTPRTQVVRELLDEAIERRTVYEEPG